MSESVVKPDETKLMPLHEAVKHALGVELHPSTFCRWAQRGVVGVNGIRRFLNYRKVGAKLMCTIQDVREFDAAINERLENRRPPKRTAADDRRTKERLQKLGII